MKKITSTFVVISCLPALALASQIPDAGHAIRSLNAVERYEGTESPLGFTSAPQYEVNQDADEPKFFVKRIEISGNTIYSTGQLKAITTAWENKELGLSDLKIIASQLTAIYRQDGYFLSQAYVPQQEVNQGVVRLLILEGAYGNIEINNRSGVSEAVVGRFFRRVAPGEPIHDQKLHTPLLLLSDTPGIEVRAVLRPGQVIGTSDLMVETTPGKPYSGSIDIDNFGTRYTGEHRISGGLSINNPAGLGDLLDMRLLKTSEDLDFFRFSYQLPIGAAGTRVGLAYSKMSYELGRDYKDLEAFGTAKVKSLYVLHPVTRSKNFNINAGLQVDLKELNNQIRLFESDSTKNLRAATASLSGHSMYKNGYAALSANLTHGRLQLDENQVDLDRLTAKTHGEFLKISLGATFARYIGRGYSVFNRTTGQLSDQNLDSSEKFDLGGPSAVRAYSQGEASGDSGWVTNIELRRTYSDNLFGYVFYDYGNVEVNRKPWRSGDNSKTLSGAGFGFGYKKDRLSLNVTLALKTSSEVDMNKDRKAKIYSQFGYSF